MGFHLRNLQKRAKREVELHKSKEPAPPPQKQAMTEPMPTKEPANSPVKQEAERPSGSARSQVPAETGLRRGGAPGQQQMEDIWECHIHRLWH